MQVILIQSIEISLYRISLLLTKPKQSEDIQKILVGDSTRTLIGTAKKESWMSEIWLYTKCIPRSDFIFYCNCRPIMINEYAKEMESNSIVKTKLKYGSSYLDNFGIGECKFGRDSQ